MTENEKELLTLIRSCNNTEKAFGIALNIILGFLKQDESSQAQPIACSQVSA